MGPTDLINGTIRPMDPKQLRAGLTVSLVGGLLFAAIVGSALDVLDLPGPANLTLWLGLPLAGVWLGAGRDGFALLGLHRFDVRGVAVAFAGSLLMLGGLAWGSESGASFDLAALWDGALRPGFVEELMFRGCLFALLYWRMGLSFVGSMLFTGLLFGAAHTPAAVLDGDMGKALGLLAMTGAGGCWYAWLFVRWNRSLWVPIVTHVAMNAWWVLFTAGPDATSVGAAGTWGRVATIVAITVATTKLTTEESDEPVG